MYQSKVKMTEDYSVVPVLLKQNMHVQFDQSSSALAVSVDIVDVGLPSPFLLSTKTNIHG
jgi:hypothetical protein